MPVIFPVRFPTRADGRDSTPPQGADCPGPEGMVEYAGRDGMTRGDPQAWMQTGTRV